ncbi:hypothetical protein [uncultured Sphingomonas sp.]|uniref:DUF5983 family protein n=1 Tax=uncultured Sphingomonas sp. TaxID=158754 RepID=UPI00262AFFD3|nr:hypothetical protein [uncultured Sphingomonas sp.]
MTNTTRSDHLALLERVRAALETYMPNNDEMHALLAEFGAGIAAIGKTAVPWPIFLHMAQITHGGGILMLAAIDHRSLLAQVADFCRGQWGEINDPRDPATLDDATATRDYFNRHPEVRLQSRKLRVDPVTGIDREELEYGVYVVLSNSHITEATACLLDEWAQTDPMQRPLSVADNHYGWFVSANPVAPADQDKLPADLAAALTFARDQGCTYLLLDRDAGTTGHLPESEW